MVASQSQRLAGQCSNLANFFLYKLSRPSSVCERVWPLRLPFILSSNVSTVFSYFVIRLLYHPVFSVFSITYFYNLSSFLCSSIFKDKTIHQHKSFACSLLVVLASTQTKHHFFCHYGYHHLTCMLKYRIMYSRKQQ